MAEKVRLHLFVKHGSDMLALCHVRGPFNFERWQPNEKVGSLQAAVTGELWADEETRLYVLYRETSTQLGEEFAELIQARLNLQPFGEANGIVHYGVLIGSSDALRIRLPISSGGMKILKAEEYFSVMQDVQAWQRHFPLPAALISCFPAITQQGGTDG